MEIAVAGEVKFLTIKADLHKQLKIHVANYGGSMKEIADNLVKEFLKKQDAKTKE